MLTLSWISVAGDSSARSDWLDNTRHLALNQVRKARPYESLPLILPIIAFLHLKHQFSYHLAIYQL